MPIDAQQIGRVTLQAMEDIDNEYGDDDELVRCMLLVEVRYTDEDSPGKKNTTVMWADDEQSPVARLGLVLMVLRGLAS